MTPEERRRAIIAKCVERIMLASQQGDGWLATVALAEVTTAWNCGESAGREAS